MVALAAVLICASDALAAPPVLTVGQIRIESDDVFARDEVAAAAGLNRFVRRMMNALHQDTAGWVVRSEFLFAEGDTFRIERLEETARNLRELGILSEVEVAAVDTSADGQVDVVVSYRESWTLRGGVSFALASGGAARGTVSMTERNFLGQAVTLQLLLGRDEDATFGRAYFRQDRFLRSRLALEFNVEERSYGYDRWARLGVPFRYDDQRWSGLLEFGHDLLELRWYLSPASFREPLAGDPSRIYALIPRQRSYVRGTLARSLAGGLRDRVWRLGLHVVATSQEYRLGDGLFALSGGEVADLSPLGRSDGPLAYASDTVVRPNVWVQTLGRDWAAARFVQNYGSREDLRLGPSLELVAGPGLPDRGVQVRGLGRHWSQIPAGFYLADLRGQATWGGREPRPSYVSLLQGVFFQHGGGRHPHLTRITGEVGGSWNLTGDQQFALGLDQGLRSLSLDGMVGDRFARWNVERGRPLPLVILGIMQTGWGVFYDGGIAAFADDDQPPVARHEVGVGLRFGSRRSSTAELARLDLTWPLNGERGLVLTSVARGYF